MTLDWGSSLRLTLVKKYQRSIVDLTPNSVTRNEETTTVMKSILKDIHILGDYSLEEDKNV